MPVPERFCTLRPNGSYLNVTVPVPGTAADSIQFDGQSCVLAVSEDLPQYDQQKAN
jgi:hypothetical protein